MTEYITAVKEFLLTCPHTVPRKLSYILIEETGLDYLEIIEQQSSDKEGSGAAIDQTGITNLSKRRNTWGVETHRNQIGFRIIFWRNTNDDEFRKNIAVFLPRLIEWINLENANRKKSDANPKLPKFSQTDYEQISANGGFRSGMIDDTRSIFTVQIQSVYELVY